jgi:hypothetical protein
MPWLVSVFDITFSVLYGCQKLGHPLPDSNFVAESNRALLQHAQR